MKNYILGFKSFNVKVINTQTDTQYMLVLVDLDDTLCNTWEAARWSVLRLLPHLIRKRKFKALLYILTQRYEELEQSRELHLLDLDELVGNFMERVYKSTSEKDLKEMFELVDKTFFSNLRSISRCN